MAKDSITSRLKVEDGNDLQVGAPMKGEVLDIKVAAGDVVEKGQGIDLFVMNAYVYRSLFEKPCYKSMTL